MKQISKLLLITLLLTGNISKGQAKGNTMKVNAGIITAKFKESKEFYVQKLGFKIKYESDWYLLLHTGGKNDSELAFMVPNHPSQNKIFQSEFSGKGIFITIEVDDVDKIYTQVKQKGVPIKIELKNEEWGDRHFAVLDPNGIGIDFVTHTPQDSK